MKICILAPRFPFPESGGDVLRINNICKYLKSRGHTVVLLTYFDKTNNESCKVLAENLYDRVYYVKRSNVTSFIFSAFAFIFNKPIQIGYYFSFSFLSKFKNLIKKEHPELYIVQLLRMVPYTNIMRLHDKTIVDMADALSKTYSFS
jgi:hypothetical protein